jgi:hypothetical protein
MSPFEERRYEKIIQIVKFKYYNNLNLKIKLIVLLSLLALIISLV